MHVPGPFLDAFRDIRCPESAPGDYFAVKPAGFTKIAAVRAAFLAIIYKPACDTMADIC